MTHGQFGHLEAARVGQRGYEAMKLALQPDLVHDVGAVGLQAAVVIVQAHARRPAHDGVEHATRYEAPPGIVAFTLPAAHQIVALVEYRQQPRQLCRIVLQVGVHRHDGSALRCAEAGGQGGRLAEVPAQPQAAHPLIAPRERADRLPRPIDAAVVDEDHLEIEPVLIRHVRDFAVEQLESAALVVEGNHDGGHG